MARTAIDPVTRIGGHLRVEVDVTGGVVRDAWSSGTMFRGMELILDGRDPRDAWLFAQRVCGTCTTAHALASVRAVENALGVVVPKNARLVRNLITGVQYVQDHVVNFYHRHAPDWVDVISARDADPAATSTLAHSISRWTQSSEAYFASVKGRLDALVESGQLGPFANGYWGHPAYRLPPEANLLLVAHYLAALEWQRKIVKVNTFFGGKNPHPQTFLVGGMALAPTWGGPGPVAREHPQVERKMHAALSDEGLAAISMLLTDAATFVEQVYLPDALLVASQYQEWGAIGGGIGNYLSYGEFPLDDSTAPVRFLPRGRVMDRSLGEVAPVEQELVAETVAHSWYTYDGGDAQLLHPFDGQTHPGYAGPSLPFTTLEGSEKYSWLKAPRYQDLPMEVGPLARMLVAYADRQADVRTGLNTAMAQVGLGVEALFSTLGRVVARAVEAQLIAKRLVGWLGELEQNMASGDVALAEITRWDPGTWPAEATGFSLGETPRGALGHWVTIRDARVDGYQLIDAGTWNGSPRDAKDRRGAWEQALIGTPVADVTQPIEILRTLHSFDPCTACAVHAFGPDIAGPLEIRVAGGRCAP